VTWEGSIAQNEVITLTFRAQASGLPSEPTYISFPAYIGYDDHYISFERPYILRVSAPDLSPSTLAVESAFSWPSRALAYTLTVRNVGTLDATTQVTAALPTHTTSYGTLDSGGIGSGEVIDQVLSWTGPVTAGGEVALRYQLLLDSAGDYQLIHEAWVGDQYGERWPVAAWTEVQLLRIYFPRLYR
jgi:hypothetical protein